MPVPTSSSTRSSNMSSSRNASPMTPSSVASRMARLEAFRKLKPTCVALMAIAAQPPTKNSQHARLIDTLTHELSGEPETSLDSAVINYILFPLTSILRQSNPSTLPDNFLESAFRLLERTTTAWRRCEGGMEVVAWEQLWRFTIAAVGNQAVGKADKGKGKEKEREPNQEINYQAVLLLAALLSPTPPEQEGLPHPTPSMLEKVATSRSPLLPTLFQTITFLLETSAPQSPFHKLQLASLKLLRQLIQAYLNGKLEVLAAILPGVISSMAKIVQAGNNLKGEVAQSVLGLIEDVITSTFSDIGLRDLGLLRPVVDDLSQLAEEWTSTEAIPPDQQTPPSPTSSASSKGPSPNPFPPLTLSYLSFTSTQLLNAIPPILSILSGHTSDLARRAVISLSYSIIQICHESLSDLQPRCLAALLSLSQDGFESVRHDAQHRLNILLQNDHLSLNTTLLDILNNAINALPRLVLSEQDKKVDEATDIIVAISQASALVIDREGNRPGNTAIADLLGPKGGVERWSWSILNCLEFGRPSGWSSTASSAERLGQIGWQRSSSSVIPLLLNNNDAPRGSDHTFPHLPLRHIESERTAKRLGEMLQSLGATGGEAALHSVEYFMLFAKANKRRQIAKSVSAIWVCERLLGGIATAQLDGVDGRISKSVRKMSRETVKILVSMDDDEERDDHDEEEPDYRDNLDAEALVPVERTKGIHTLTTLLDKKPIPNTQASRETRRLHNQAQRSLLTCLSLQTLTLTSRILSSSFRPLLLTSLYVILSHLASPQPIIREYATIALHTISYNVGYASPQNMVLDNVDYVINIVSLHLLPAKLSPNAPLVLIAMIRLVGPDIVPMVHDLVDEIFDALDDYHGYEALASSLLAVLGTLIEVMNDEIALQGITPERKKHLDENRRVEKPPNLKDDFEQFFGWYSDRENRRKAEVQEILQRAPQHAWGKADLINDATEDEEEGIKHNGDGEEGEEPKVEVEEEQEVPPTRTQEVCIRILTKSIYFLTHNSPFLRYKILSIIGNATQVLARGNREKELLPLLNDSWNSILNRLDDTQPYIKVAALESISKMCEEVGDFMSKRVLDHVWPRIKVILADQWKSDKQSAMSKHRNYSSAGGSGINVDIGMDQYSVSRKLHKSILGIILFILKEVPVDDSVIWEILLVSRPFLDKKAQEDLQQMAKDVYEELSRRNGDVTFLVLNATLGGLEGDKGVWNYLREERLDIADNAENISLMSANA
ncbi:uncharacterized protein I303_103911 [Kwoniella dejecticola CBS 10117]|uniref:Uncharacterized protein n=1 Tax=Kwoniella dejecticola CBS 10117 TaxID=1296121 RepID=A0A1A6A826_9TREE|nr:uncharacterized protein I303_03929 [Kwoniella dejecticola CBS 10117]OBR86209.1 hypothetical protein I303_03929 [Kwoniella dejecticola CBS 10117]